MTDKPQIHLIDGNAIGYAANNVNLGLKSGDRPTGATYGLVRAMRMLQVEQPKSKKIVLWDGKSKWRVEQCPGYKGKRNDTREKIRVRAIYKAQAPDMEAAMLHLGIDQVRSPNCEADDLAAAYVAAFEHKGWRTRMVTSDKDWLQLITERTDWYDPVRSALCNHETFSAFTGFESPAQFVDYKCLKGDTSDNIKGVGGIGEGNARALLQAHHSVNNFVRVYQIMGDRLTGLPKLWIELAENFEGKLDRYHANKKLMELVPGLPGVEDKVVKKGVVNPEAFRTLCENLGFMSVTANFDNWIEPFMKRTT